jgi:hypothetical protein
MIGGGTILSSLREWAAGDGSDAATTSSFSSSLLLEEFLPSSLQSLISRLLMRAVLVEGGDALFTLRYCLSLSTS